MKKPLTFDPVDMEIGSRFQRTRIALNIVQDDAAKIMGVSRNALSNYERGERPLAIKMAMRFCQRYGVPLDWIYLGDPSGMRKDLADKILGASSPPSGKAPRARHAA